MNTPSNSIDSQGGEGKAETGDLFRLFIFDTFCEYREQEGRETISGSSIMKFAEMCANKYVEAPELLSQLNAAKAEADALRREVDELNQRGEALTRDFNNAKKLLNQYMEFIQELKEENAKLKNYE